MKVSELIAQLQQLPGDYEVAVWDHLAEKYQAPALEVKNGIEYVLLETEATA